MSICVHIIVTRLVNKYMFAEKNQSCQQKRSMALLGKLRPSIKPTRIFSICSPLLGSSLQETLSKSPSCASTWLSRNHPGMFNHFRYGDSIVDVIYVICIRGITRDESLYKNASEFRPERFLTKAQGGDCETEDDIPLDPRQVIFGYGRRYVCSVSIESKVVDVTTEFVPVRTLPTYHSGSLLQ